MRPAAELQEQSESADAGLVVDAGGAADSGTAIPDAGFCPIDGAREVRLRDYFEWEFQNWAFVSGGISSVWESPEGPRFARYSSSLQRVGPEVAFAQGGYRGIAQPRLRTLGATSVITWRQWDGGQEETLFAARVDPEGRLLFTAQGDGGTPGYVATTRIRPRFSAIYRATISVNEQCILLLWSDPCGGSWLRGRTITPDGNPVSGVVDLVPFTYERPEDYCDGNFVKVFESVAPIGSSDFALGTGGRFERYNCSLQRQSGWERVPPLLPSLWSWVYPLMNGATFDGGSPDELVGVITMTDEFSGSIWIWNSSADGGTLSFVADGGEQSAAYALLSGGRGPIAVWKDFNPQVSGPDSSNPRLFAQGPGTPKLELIPQAGALAGYGYAQVASLGGGVHALLMELDAGSGPDGGGVGHYARLVCDSELSGPSP